MDKKKKNIPARAEYSSAPEIVEGIRRRALNAPVAYKLLREQMDQSFPPDRVVELLNKLTDAEDVRFTKKGEPVMIPNWIARERGLEKVLRIMGAYKAETEESEYGIPAKVTFNVIYNSKGEKYGGRRKLKNIPPDAKDEIKE